MTEIIEKENEIIMNEEDVQEENVTKTERSLDDVVSEYKSMVDMIKVMDEQYKMLYDTTCEQLDFNYSMKKNILDILIAYSDNDINNMNIEEIESVIGRYSTVDNNSDKLYNEYLDSEKEIHGNDETYIYKNKEDYLKEILFDIKKMAISLLQSKRDADGIKKETQSAMDEYFKKYSSTELVEKKLNKINEYKEKLKTETDAEQRYRMKEKVKIMENSLTFDFLFKPFETNLDKEVNSIKRSFFDSSSSKYIINKYERKIIKFGFNNNIYKNFFNIEEMFLPEEYHVFNNLFLFIYMRFISKADPYREDHKKYVESLTSSLSNLIYHRYSSTEQEEEFINIIKRILDYFQEYKDYFNEFNTTHPKHTMRIEADAKHEEKRKEMLVTRMNELKITGYDINSSADQLQEYLNNELEKRINIELDNAKTNISQEENNEENSTINN